MGSAATATLVVFREVLESALIIGIIGNVVRTAQILLRRPEI